MPLREIYLIEVCCYFITFIIVVFVVDVISWTHVAQAGLKVPT